MSRIIIICSQTQLDNIAHEQTIICRQLFAGHVSGSQPMKRKNNLHQMIIHKIIIITIMMMIMMIMITNGFMIVHVYVPDLNGI